MAVKKSATTVRKVGKKTKPKATAKTTTKKQSVSARKKSAATKSSKLKEVVKKTTTKAASKKTGLNRKSFTEKLAERTAVSDNVTILDRNTATAKTQLMILSPYRFPLQIDNLAIQTARVSGIFFVLVGAFFTLLYSTGFSSTATIANLSTKVSQLASVCDPMSGSYNPDDPTCVGNFSGGSAEIDQQSGCLLTDQQCLDAFYGTSGLDGAATDPINTQPPATITLDKTSPLTGQVRIRVTVDLATDVFIYVYDHLTQTQIKLGAALKINDKTWELPWDTTKQLDGEYKVRAFIKNQYGGYEAFSTYYAVDNVPAEVMTNEVGTTTDATATTTEDINVDTSSPDKVDVISVKMTKTQPVSGIVPIIVAASNANKIKISALNKDTNKSTILGYAYFVSGTEWRYAFNTALVPDGNYRVVAQAFDAANNVDTGAVTFAIKNVVTTTATTTTGTTDPIVTEGTSADSESTTDNQTTLIQESNNLDPQLNLSIKASSPVSGSVDIRVDAKSVDFIELYIEPKLSATPKYLGMAHLVDVDRWIFSWNTLNTPNGEYKIYAKAKNKYGVFLSGKVATMVYNKPVVVYTEEQKETITELETVEVESNTETIIKEVIEEADDGETGTNSVSTIEKEVVDLLAKFKERLEDELSRLAAALRVGDQDAVTRVKERIRKLRDEIIASELDAVKSRELVTIIDEKLNLTIKRIEEDVVKTNAIIAERTSVSATTDSDNDGISDFDEINIFGTDPFAADSDNDGFNDGAEILSGYNPKDDSPEALVEFESPKEVGIVREDILVVQNVVAVRQEPEDTDGVKEEAIISGKALPNSYVTIYIYSTPVIVTIKTDDDGSWQYRFDKELEDGEHEVYVGVTDNAGKIIAKSEPYRFVKTAQAFTPVDAATGVSVGTTNDQGLFSIYWIYLVLSISVVAIGLVLILLGLHLDHRKKEELAREPSTEPEL